MRTLLFDIDGTLLLTNQGGSGALKVAIEQEFGVQNACTAVEFSGRTDRSLLGELLHRNDLPASREFQERLRERYVQLFPGILRQRGGYLLPGASELVQRLSQHSQLRCYVMTGNLQSTALHKLEHFGIHGFFRGIFGGDEDVHRDCLARRAARLIRDRYGDDALGDMMVIGDTPADIRCGHAIGAKVVAVCTGNHGRLELEAEQPMSVHDDLSDVDYLFDLLVG